MPYQFISQHIFLWPVVYRAQWAILLDSADCAIASAALPVSRISIVCSKHAWPIHWIYAPMCVAKHCAHEHEWRCTYLTSPWWSQWMTPLLDSEELLAVWMALTPAGPSTPAVWVLPPPYSTYHLLCNYHKWTHYMRWIHKLVNRNIFIILVPYTWRKVSSVAYYYLNSKRLTVATVWSCLFRIFIATVCLVSRFRHVASLPKPPSPRKDSTR